MLIAADLPLLLPSGRLLEQSPASYHAITGDPPSSYRGEDLSSLPLGGKEQDPR